MPNLANILEKRWFFLILTGFQLFVACFIFGNEIQSLTLANRIPGGNYPIEHVDSLERVMVFSIWALMIFPIVLVLSIRKTGRQFLPPVIPVVIIALILLLVSANYTHYLSLMGWCCENPTAYFFGYPFSFLAAITGLNAPSLNLLEALRRPDLTGEWIFSFYTFLFDALFWVSVVFFGLSLPGLVAYPVKAARVVQTK